MGVRIDAARDHIAISRVERAVAAQVVADLDDGLAFDLDVGLSAAVGVDHRSALDDDRHECLSVTSPHSPSRTGVFRRPMRGEGKLLQDTISAFSSAACISTLAPAVDHSCLMSSLSLWLTPSTQGVKIIEVGVIRAM